MYGSTAAESTADSERTAFRKAEKRYKRYKAPSSLKPGRMHRNDQILSTDLSDVVDFQLVIRRHQNGEDLPPGIRHAHCPGFPHTVFCFHGRPGFYFIPGALSIEEQSHWIRKSLTSFPQPPNRTNHTATYGPLYDLFDAVQGEKILVEVGDSVAELGHEHDGNGRKLEACRYMLTENSPSLRNDQPCKAIPASMLLRKLRWSTLGLQFDWSKRNYDISLPYIKIPDELCLLSKKMAAPAMPPGEDFSPEAAIVNYFGPSDMLGGHLDDMEADWSKPIVSISLGCKAIFLLGGRSREDLPVAMFLRSGDVVLMAGQARECYHGVPRIFTDEDNADIAPLLLKLYQEDYVFIEKYIKTSRININIRQVN